MSPDPRKPPAPRPGKPINEAPDDHARTRTNPDPEDPRLTPGHRAQPGEQVPPKTPRPAEEP